MPIKYGKQIELRRDGEMTIMSETIFANSDIVAQMNVMSDIQKVKNLDEVISIFLKMIDDQKSGAKSLIGIQCLNNQNTGELRIKRYWVAD